jgi:hypothetical protein
VSLRLPRCGAPVPERTAGRRSTATPTKAVAGQTPGVSSDFVCRGESGAGNPTGSLRLTNALRAKH